MRSQPSNASPRGTRVRYSAWAVGVNGCGVDDQAGRGGQSDHAEVRSVLEPGGPREHARTAGARARRSRVWQV